jgi:hypothetical protein
MFQSRSTQYTSSNTNTDHHLRNLIADTTQQRSGGTNRKARGRSRPPHFLPAIFPAPLASAPPPAACAAFLAVFSCSALASLSRRCSGVSPSSRPFATGRRACALCRSRCRWSPRADASGQGQQQQHHPKHTTPVEYEDLKSNKSLRK